MDIGAVSQIKIANRKATLSAFQSGDTLSASDVSRMAGLSHQTCSRAIEYFVEKGLLEKSGKGASSATGGRKPEQFFLSRNLYVLCINVESSVVLFHRFNLMSELAGDWQKDLSETNTQEEFWSTIKDGVDALCPQENDLRQIVAVCLTIRGLVDQASGVLRSSIYFPTWERNEPLRKNLGQLFPYTATILIDKPVKVLSKSILNGPDETLKNKRVFVLYAQQGIAAGLIDHSKVENGAHSLIGEIGHMVVHPNYDRPCSCGNHGCFEQLVSLDELRHQAQQHTDAIKSTCLASSLDKLTYPMLFKASSSGDRLARLLCDYLADIFATVFKATAVFFDPEVLVLIGNFAFGDDYFFSQFKKNLQKFKYLPNDYNLKIICEKRDIKNLLIDGTAKAIISDFFGNPGIYC